MRLASLFSGGKDSTFAAFRAASLGHDLSCLVTVLPVSEESHLLHHPTIEATRLQARLMNLPQIMVSSGSAETGDETAAIRGALESAKEKFGVEGLVHGGIASNFQKRHFDSVCADLGLEVLAPLWHVDGAKYLRDLVSTGFRFIVTSVTAEGLDDSWLGREVTGDDVERLLALSSRFGFNATFEGGEAETFVVGCPLFSGRIRIIKSRKTWDGYRGRFEITEAVLEEQC